MLKAVRHVDRRVFFSQLGNAFAPLLGNVTQVFKNVQRRQALRMYGLKRIPSRPFSSARVTNNGGVNGTDILSPTPPIYSLADTKSTNKRKYFWTLEQLNKKTDHLIAYSSATNLRASRILHRNRQPLATEFFQVLEAWMEQCLAGEGIEAANKARALLYAMLVPQTPEHSGDENGSIANPQSTRPSSHAAFMANVLTSGHYDVVLQAYAVSGGGAEAAEQAEALLERILAHCRASLRLRTHMPPEPTIKTFNILLNCWAKSGAPDAADRATRLLQLMEEWNVECQTAAVTPHHSFRYSGCWANEISLVSLIEAWTYSKPSEAPEQALALLQEVMFALDNTDPSLGQTNAHKYRDVDLDVVVFNAVIYAWVRSNRGRKAAWQAEEILQVLMQWSQIVKLGEAGTRYSDYRATVRPNTRTYSMVIMAWAECESREQSGFAAQRAEKILWKMLQLYRDGGNDIKPNAILVTMCIAAWSRAASTCAHAPERAEQLWSLLCQLYAETGHSDRDLEPTTEMGNAVISAWARCTSRLDSVPRALAALEKLKDTAKADLISYNTVLDAMSKRGMGNEAVGLLHEMEHARQNVESSVPWPDRVSYNSVLAALSRAKFNRDSSAEEAEKLLKRMDTLATMQLPPDGTTLDLKPDRLSYTSVINAWSRSDTLDKVQRAMTLVQDMVCQFHEGNESLRPDVVVYTILIKACVHCFGALQDKQRALDIATEAMQTLETTEFGPPNDVAYATFMNAIFRLSESASQRETLLEETFRSCAARGQVSKNVIKEMDRGGSRKLFRRLTNNTNKLLPAWYSNVASKDRPLV